MLLLKDFRKKQAILYLINLSLLVKNYPSLLQQTLVRSLNKILRIFNLFLISSYSFVFDIDNFRKFYAFLSLLTILTY